MIKHIQRGVGRLLLLILTLTILLSSLASCGLFSYVAESKEEIQENLDGASHISSYGYVSDYLRRWGMPTFDRMKFQYFEECFIQLFNYESGMPSTFDHAKMTAELFLKECYDEIDTADKTAVTDALLNCYVVSLGDPYSAYRPPVEAEDFMTDMSGKFGGIGVMVEYNDQDESIMINTVYPDSPAEKAGIKVGDYIHAVDGKTVEELGYTNAVNYVRGEIGTDVELTMLRGEELITVVATRAEVEELNVVYEISEDKTVGYVQIVAFKGNTFDQFKEAIDSLEAAGVKGVIFDLRGNPGGYVDSVVSVISYLIPDGKTVMSYQYKFEDAVELVSDDDGDKDHVLDLPFVVLCNQYTASAGEIFTAAMRDYRNAGDLKATIVGTTTYKKGIMQNTYYYPLDQSTVTLTVAYYNPPCGVNYHGIGVTPDIYVENTATEDLQFNTALEEMNKLINDN
ncbi:MAG: S41 family peptidase [Clostridia bacterium]|nr:S41 family peptidase [Clostridia bacterium]